MEGGDSKNRRGSEDDRGPHQAAGGGGKRDVEMVGSKYSSLSCALEACKRVPEHEQTPVEFAAFETKEQQSKYIAGVQAVNNLPGPHRYAAVPLEYYLLSIS